MFPEISTEDVEQWRETMGLPSVTVEKIQVFAASTLVKDWLQTKVWDPHNAAHVEAIQVAVAWTVSTWIGADIDPMTEGLQATLNTVSSASLMGGSFSNANPAAIARRRVNTTSSLPASPVTLLQEAGIRSARVQVVG